MYYENLLTREREREGNSWCPLSFFGGSNRDCDVSTTLLGRVLVAVLLVPVLGLATALALRGVV